MRWMNRSSGGGRYSVTTTNTPLPTLLLASRISPDLSVISRLSFFKGLEKSVFLYEISKLLNILRGL